MVLLMPFVAGTSKRVTAFLILSTSQLRKIYENKAQCILVRFVIFIVIDI